MKLLKEIKSKYGITHFKRWSMISTKWFSVYLHGIYKEDQDKYLHNHPWNILTIIIYGSYIEQLENDLVKIRGIFNIGFHGRSSYHKIKKLLSKKVYSLAIVWGKHDDNWGYKFEGKHIDNRSFREYKNGITNWHEQ